MIADQNDSNCENEIVTLRGGVCLVVIRKPKSHHGDTENSGTGKQPQISADER